MHDVAREHLAGVKDNVLLHVVRDVGVCAGIGLVEFAPVVLVEHLCRATHDGGADEELHAGKRIWLCSLRIVMAVEQRKAGIRGGVYASAVGVAASDS